MSKELEALILSLEEFKLSKTAESCLLRFDREEVLEMLKALTPPTEEEVCKAIRKDLGEQPIKYNKTYKQFYGLYANEEDEIVTLKNDKIIIWRGNYSVETLDMIVRFYKGERK